MTPSGIEISIDRIKPPMRIVSVIGSVSPSSSVTGSRVFREIPKSP